MSQRHRSAETVLPLGKLHGLRQEYRAGVAIELYQRGGQAIDLPWFDAVGLDSAFQRLVFVKPAHGDEPVNDRSTRIDCKPACGGSKRHNAKVDIGRKPPVEAQLGTARRLSAFESREIEIGKSNRLLEFVDPISGHKDP